jgi:hypothetical protein
MCGIFGFALKRHVPMEELNNIISQGKFEKTLEIPYGAEASLKLSLTLAFK